jgi:hemerythrin
MITSRNPEVAHECVQLLALNAFDNLQAHSRRIESLCDDMATLPTMPDGHPTTIFLLQEFIRVVAEFFRYQENLMEHLGYPDLDSHHGQHAEIIGEALSMQASCRGGRMSFNDSVWSLRALILNHLNGADQHFQRFSKDK